MVGMMVATMVLSTAAMNVAIRQAARMSRRWPWFGRSATWACALPRLPPAVSGIRWFLPRTGAGAVLSPRGWRDNWFGWGGGVQGPGLQRDVPVRRYRSL